ncbi:MAG: toxin-antitoxin system HicB family antitoxin [Ardenticatenaceae bacterium]|nr:toxin-antitoxin system HicB family antitoxin [Ardenticatenaceae bacterium]
MSVLSLRLPNSLHEEVRNLARDEGISINQFIMLAVAEKIASLRTSNYLEARAKRAGREDLLEILGKAPDVEPEPYDQLPEKE